MAQNFLPPAKMAIGFAPVVVNTGAQLVLFDTGNGAARRPDAGRLASLLATAGFQPEQIDLVVLSHFHPDHIGGLVEEGQPLLPNARYVTAAAEYDFWSPQDQLSGPTERVATLVQANVVPLAEKTTFIKEGAEVVPGIEALAAFGHTPGHMAFHIGERRRAAGRDRGHREPFRGLAAAARLARPLRHGQGAGDRLTPTHLRYDRHGADPVQRLSHAVPGGRLRRADRPRLPLCAGRVSARPVTPAGAVPAG